MGRRKKINTDDPPRFYTVTGKRKTAHYYTGVRPKIRLSNNRNEALKQWADMEAGKELIPTKFKGIAAKYKKEIIPQKAPRTQQDNLKELDKLLAVFGEMHIDAIKPKHVRQYITRREAKVRANREKALLSHIYNFARDKGYTDLPNPCQGIKGNKEKGRDRYVTNEEYADVWEVANPMLQNIMDLLLNTAQRPADVLKMKKSDIRDGAIWIEQNKTGKKIGIDITPHLDAILKRRKEVSSFYVVSDKNGQPVSQTTLRSWFRTAREKAKVNFQLRDLRSKNATDTENIELAKKRLGHSTIRMTEHYTKNRKGERVRPLI